MDRQELEALDRLLHRRMYLAHNEMQQAVDAIHHTLRKAIEDVLPAVWLVASWVESLEPWYGFEDRDPAAAAARTGLTTILELLEAVRWAKAGKSSRLKASAAAARVSLKKLLAIADDDRHDWQDKLERAEGKIALTQKQRASEAAAVRAGRALPRSRSGPDFLDAVRWNKAAGVQMVRPGYDSDGPEPGSDAEFRALFGRPRGRPPQLRDELKTVLEAIRKWPEGLALDTLCRVLKMRKQAVTAAYKELENAGLIRVERTGSRGKRLLFPNSQP